MRWSKRDDHSDDVLGQVVLGNGLRRQYEASGDVRLLDASVEVLEEAAAKAAGIRSPDLSAALSDLGLSLRERARRRGNPKDLAAAVAAHEEAYRLVAPASPHKAGMAGNLAGSLRQRWELTGERADLERAVQLYREAVTRVPPGIPYAAETLTNLANGLGDWYSYTGNRADLDDAVEAAEAAVVATESDSPARPRRLANAAGVLRRRGELAGQAADLTKAVDFASEALAATPRGSAEYGDRYGTLTSVLASWYVFSGELAVLDQAVDLGRQGLERAEGEQVEPILINLAAAYRLRYDVYEQPVDLQQALTATQVVLDRFKVAATPDRAEVLQSAASLHRLAGDATGDLSHLDAAEAALDEAATIVPNHSTVVAKITAQHGQLVFRRWQLGDPRATLDDAVRLQETALAAADRSALDRSDLARLIYQLATTVAQRGAAEGRDEDLRRAEELLSELAQFQLPEFDIDLAAPVAHAQGLVAAYQGRDADAAEAFSETLASVRRRFAREITQRHREGVLGVAQGVPAQAAIAMMRAGRIAEAVVALELGQAVLTSEALARETIDVDRVAAVDPVLAARLRTAALRLADAERRDRSDVTRSEAEYGALTAASAEFDACLTEIRSHPQLTDVLVPPGLNDVLAAAAELPLVYLAADRRHGCAFLIPPGAGPDDVVAIQLPDLTADSLKRRLGSHMEAASAQGPHSSAELESFLSWLGTAAIEPWLAELAALKSEAICLVPVGMLALCPLHAATLPSEAGQPAEPLIERVAVSFAANARTITLARSRAAARLLDNVVVVGEPQPVAATSLPFARAEAERIADAYLGSTLLTGQQATLERVRHHLGIADLAHLACHGEALPMSPRASALLLANDERLTMGDLLQSRVAARLVLLSACESSVPGLALPDEVVALPTGLVQAGAAGVIGSLWRVPDASAAALMVRVHELLLTGAAPATALARAQGWLRRATNRELAEWWPTIAPPPQATSQSAREFWSAGRPFTDPRHWAAFVHIGA
jgi:CHAT domain-containing protein/tetratricopeptide (TPR) repeat protein